MSALQVRLVNPHTDLTGSEWDDHEWWIAGELKANRLGVPNSRMMCADWFRVECNNTDCAGWGLVRKDVVTALLDTVTS
jgi:hypothetical protein